jgi:L-iditol 2-dehydrogenase
MQAAVYLGIEQMVIQEIPEPTCGDHELLLEVNLVGLCGSDVKAFYQGRSTLIPPQVMGHEVVGTVIELGRNVKGYEVGDRVALATEVGCGTCDWCHQGEYRFCTEGGPLGWRYAGGFARYMTIPEQAVIQGNAVRFPPHVPNEEAVFLEPFACCINAQRFIRYQPGATVAIIGAGSNGCINAKLAGLQPISKLIMINSSSEKRIEMARKAGVSADRFIIASEEDPLSAVMEETNGRGANIVIVSAPSSEAQELAVKLAAVGGQISLFAGLPIGSRPVQFDTNAIHYREITVYGGFSSTLGDCLKARDLLANGQIELEPIITHHFALPDLVRAIRMFHSGEMLKAVIHPS